MYIFQRSDLKKAAIAAVLIAGLSVFTGCGSADVQETAANEQETAADETEAEIISKEWETPVIELGDEYTFSEDVADYVSLSDETLYEQMTLDNEVDLTAPGEYEIKVSGFGQEFAFPVVVQDTVYPELEVLNSQYLVTVKHEIGVEDLFVSSDDNDEEYICGYYGVEKINDLDESAIDEIRDNEGSLPAYTQEKLDLDDTQILSSVTLEEEGVYQVNAAAVDRSGNATVSPIRFVVDGTAPEINLSREEVTVYFDEDLDFQKWFVSAEDNVTLPEKCYIGLREGHFNEISEKFNNLEEGTYSVDYYARDEAGNISYKTIAVTLKNRGSGGQSQGQGQSQEQGQSQGQGQSQSQTQTPSASEPHYDEEMARAALAEVNQYRAAAGQAALSWSDSLYEGCKIRAAEIAISFSHTRPNGETCYSVFPGGFLTMGENIAQSQRSAHEVAVAWYNSEGHRMNMLLGDYTQAAIACYVANGTYYWVNLFGG